MHRIPNPEGYTGELFIADVIDVLPGAMYDLHRCGILTICGHCGEPQAGGVVMINTLAEHEKIIAVEIIAVCRTCLNTPLLPMADWQHIGDDSRLFFEEPDWSEAVQRLRLLPVLSGRYGPCVVMGGWS
jgi:hypothetical protein